MQNLHYFHVKTKIYVDFQICISVPLKWKKKRNVITTINIEYA